MALQPLCPSLALWRISYTAFGRDCIILHLEPVRGKAGCPVCEAPKSRVHSRYRCRACDLPRSRWLVRMSLGAHPFFCGAPQCPRRIFAEPFSPVLGRHTRRTGRAQAALLGLAHASSGQRAALVARLLGFIVSPDSLIRWQRQEQFVASTPWSLGVDEFALRRGRTFSILLGDLLRRHPVDLLEGKDAPPLPVGVENIPGWPFWPGIAPVLTPRASGWPSPEPCSWPTVSTWCAMWARPCANCCPPPLDQA